uniref:Uncharacterized protein n=1 Tax=Ciona savignyi TaxID=51511 RepID=H2ZAN8_CIOSA
MSFQQGDKTTCNTDYNRQYSKEVSNTYRSSIFNYGENASSKCEENARRPVKISKTLQSSIFQPLDSAQNANSSKAACQSRLFAVPRPNTAPCKRDVSLTMKSSVFANPQYPRQKPSEEAGVIRKTRTAWKPNNKNVSSTVFSSEPGNPNTKARRSLQKKSTVFDTQLESKKKSTRGGPQISRTFSSHVLPQKKESTLPVKSLSKAFEKKCNLSGGCSVVSDAPSQKGILCRPNSPNKSTTTDGVIIGGSGGSDGAEVLISSNVKSNALIKPRKGKKANQQSVEVAAPWSYGKAGQKPVWSSGFKPTKLNHRTIQTKTFESKVFSGDSAKTTIYSADYKCTPLKS